MKRTEILGLATDSLRASRDYYINDSFEEGRIAGQIADVLLDLATSLTPGISWVRDIYEAISGKDLHSGEALDSFSHSTAVLGAVTIGYGSKAIIVNYARDMKRGLMNIVEAMKTGRRFRRACYNQQVWFHTTKRDDDGREPIFQFRLEEMLAEDWEVEEETVTLTREQLRDRLLSLEAATFHHFPIEKLTQAIFGD